MPQEMKAADLALFLPDQNHDQIFERSELMTFEWIEIYMCEIQQVESFFSSKLDELISQFIQLQDNFRIKADMFEDDKLEKEKKKKLKEAGFTVNFSGNLEATQD